MKKLLIFILAVVLLMTPVAADGSDTTTSATDGNMAQAGDIEMESEEADGEDIDVSIFEDETVPASAADVVIPAPSAILIEKETGTILYEKNADEQLMPASVTKVMTILLIVEAVENGKITLDDTVTVSTHAASMGGSQVYLEEGEQMKVSELFKCVVVSSANDAAVALAEYIYGTEGVFVAAMNERAKELGCTGTNFTNCTGLMDDTTHVTTARDLAIMSRELIQYDWVKEYTTIWMDTIRDGEFGLSNTNKLIYYYDGATGLKTGFTQAAGYCLSATAERGGVEYIAVVMHCTTSVERFESAKTLLSFAFANYTLYSAAPDTDLTPIPVSMGDADMVLPVVQAVQNLLVENSRASSLTKTVEVAEEVTAPVAQGQQLGMLTIRDGDTVLAEIPIVASTAVGRLSLGQIFMRLLSVMFYGGV